MSHFAEVINGVVKRVLVVEQSYIDEGYLGDPSNWIQTSYNTRHGVYYTPNTNTPDPDQSKALRKNFAQVGVVYDKDRDAFYEQQPYPSWLFNESECFWYCPVDYPWDDPYSYEWNEELLEWSKI